MNGERADAVERVRGVRAAEVATERSEQRQARLHSRTPTRWAVRCEQRVERTFVHAVGICSEGDEPM